MNKQDSQPLGTALPQQASSCSDPVGVASGPNAEADHKDYMLVRLFAGSHSGCPARFKPSHHIQLGIRRHRETVREARRTPRSLCSACAVPALSRFPSPEQLKTLPMPAEESLRLDVDQSVLPYEEPREKDQRQPWGVGRPPRLDLALEVKGELFLEEHIFRFDRSA